MSGGTSTHDKSTLTQDSHQRNRRPTRDQRRLGAAIGLLVISALVFCIVVARQRDVRLRQIQMNEVRDVCTWIGDYYKLHGFLPPALPADEPPFSSFLPLVPYPQSRQLRFLRDYKQPFLLAANSRVGMITPGGDGFAVVLFYDGKVSADWITPQRFAELRDARKELFSSP